MEIHKILEESLKFKNINNLLKFLLSNYKIFDYIKNNISNDLSVDEFKSKIFNRTKQDLLLLYRLLEQNFYDLISKQANRNLKYKNELSNKVLNNQNKNKTYLVFVTNNKLNFDIFRVYLLFYYVNIRLYKKNLYLGLDFEFNTKVVALMQLNFEQPRFDLYDSSLIFLIDPNQLSSKWKIMFTEKILCNSNVVKILHGSDSLDIPYVYNELLESNKKLITKFNKSFIDTKFLCEYSYYDKNLPLGKCKINYVLVNENVITETKLNELLEEENKMGPIYDIIININTLSELLINYSFYDVLFLYHLIDVYRNNIKEFDLINELTQLIFMDKRDISEIVPKLEINKINNYYVMIKKPMRLIDIFNIFLKLIIKNELINKLLKINYFKGNLLLIFKYELYSYIVDKYIVYEKFSERLKYNKQILKMSSNYDNKVNFNSKIIKFIKSKLRSF